MMTVLPCDSAMHEELLRHRAEALDVGNECGAGRLAAFASGLSEGCQTRNLGDEHKLDAIVYHEGRVCLLEVQLVRTPASKNPVAASVRDGLRPTNARQAEQTTATAKENARSATSAVAASLDTEPFPGYRDLEIERES